MLRPATRSEFSGRSDVGGDRSIGSEALEVPVAAGGGLYERARVILPRSRQDGLRPSSFDDMAVLHHDHSVADLRRNAQVVGDEQHRNPGKRTNFFQ